MSASRVLLRSPGRVVDPLPIVTSGLSSTALGSFRIWVDNMRNRLKSRRQESVIRTNMTDYSPISINREHAPDLFRAFMSAYSANDESALEAVCTPTLFGRVKAGLAADVAETGGVCGMDVLSGLAAPDIAWLRTWHPRMELEQSLMEKPHVAQVAVKLVHAQRPTFRPVTREATLAGRIEASSRARTKPRKLHIVASAKAPSTGAVPATFTGTWMPALDNASGHTYYFNDLTGAVSWEPPASLGMLEPTRPLRLVDIGTEVEEYTGVNLPSVEGSAIASAAKQEGGAPSDTGMLEALFRVSTYVVLERMFPYVARTENESKWRLAAVL
jgi:hypothetical protein